MRKAEAAASEEEGYRKALVLVSGSRWAGGSLLLPGTGRDYGGNSGEAPLAEDGVEGVGGGHPEDCLWGHRQDHLSGNTIITIRQFEGGQVLFGKVFRVRILSKLFSLDFNGKGDYCDFYMRQDRIGRQVVKKWKGSSAQLVFLSSLS